MQETDTVARFDGDDGDEFLIMINNIHDAKDIVKIADNIMKLFERPFNLNEQEFFITGGAGVAVYPVDGEDVGTLIKNADIAMYSARSRGKSRYALCTEDMKEDWNFLIRKCAAMCKGTTADQG